MKCGRDYTISACKPRNHGAYRGDHGRRRNLKSKRCDVACRIMSNAAQYQEERARRLGKGSKKR